MDKEKDWDSKWKQIDKRLPPTAFARKSFEFIKNKKLKTLLDLGCCYGKDSVYFAKNQLEVTAVDFSKEALNLLKDHIEKKKIKNIIISKQDIADLKFKNKFDIIYASLSLHGFDDKTTNKIFKKLYSSLNKKGYIFIRYKSTHFTEENIRKKMKSFKIIQIKSYASKHTMVDSREINERFVELIAQK